MTQEAFDLLPYEFARANRVLRDDGDLLLGPDAPDWAIAEVSRITSGDLNIRNVEKAIKKQSPKQLALKLSYRNSNFLFL